MNVHVFVDRAIGTSTRWLQRRLEPKTDTTSLLAHYRDQPLEVLFPPPPARPYVEASDPHVLGPFSTRRLRVASAHVPLVEPLRRCYELQPELHQFHARELAWSARRPRRAVVYVHGWMETTDLATEALLAPVVAAKLGADFFHFQLPHHWKRQVAGSKYNGAFFCTADLAQTAEAFRQAVLDARTLLAWVWSLGRYDEVGMMGISLGGLLTQMVACVDRTLSWAVPMVSHLDLADLLQHAAILTQVRDELAAFGVGAEDVASLVSALGLDRLEPAIERSRLFPIVAREDQFMRAAAAQRAFARWDGVRVKWIPGGHITALFGLPRILDEVRRSLDALPKAERAVAA